MDTFNEKMKDAFKPGTKSGKVSFGILFFLIGLLFVIFGFWKTLLIAVITLLGVFIGSAETLGKATSKLIDKVYPEKNKKIVYTAEDLEKVKKAAEMKRQAQQKTEEAKEEA